MKGKDREEKRKKDKKDKARERQGKRKKETAKKEKKKPLAGFPSHLRPKLGWGGKTLVVKRFSGRRGGGEGILQRKKIWREKTLFHRTGVNLVGVYSVFGRYWQG